MTQPAPGLTGTCANCNWINGHDARCPTLTAEPWLNAVDADGNLYHRFPALVEEQVLRTFQCAHCGAIGTQPTHRTDCPLSDRGYIGRHEAPAFPTEPVPSVDPYQTEVMRGMNHPVGAVPTEPEPAGHECPVC